MAQSGNEILQKILGVCVQINKKIGGDKPTGDGTAGASNKSSVGSISGIFGKKGSFKDAEKGKDAINGIFKSLSNFAKLKIRPKKIDAVSKSLKGLFVTIVWIGSKYKIIWSTMQLFTSLVKTLSAMAKFVEAITGLLLSIGLAILMIAGSLWAAGKLLGTKGPLGTILIIGGVIWGLVKMMELMAKAGKNTRKGAKTAKQMGFALMSLAGGLLSFVISLQLISGIMGTGHGPKALLLGMATMVGIVVAMGGVFALLGLFEKSGLIRGGATAAIFMGAALISLSIGLYAFALVGKLITGMGDGGTATKKAGVDKDGKQQYEKRGQFGQMMANIGPGLGVMGILLVSSTLLFAGMGLISYIILPGVLTGLAVAGGLLMMAVATKKVVDMTNKIEKSVGPAGVKGTISTMVGSLIGGLISGLSLGLTGTEVTSAKDLSLRGVVKLFRGIKLLHKTSKMLSMFALALTAFAKLDNMRVIESYDEETGKPKFGESVDIRGVGDKVRDTLVSFLVGKDGKGGLVAATSGLAFGQAAKIKKMGRALTGKRGILTAIIQFAEVLKTFAKFGKEGKIGYVDMIPAGTDEDGNAIFKQEPKTVKIIDVTKNITDSFSLFVEKISENVTGITKRHKHKILALSEALMGKKRSKIGGWFASDKPGLLEPINAFSETLMTYAKYGKDGSIPVLDENGNPTDKSVSITDIVTNIVKAISKFSTELSTQLKDPGESTKNAQKRMEGYMGLIEQLSVLGSASEGLDKTAAAIISLASGMGKLADSVNKFDVDKLAIVASIAKENQGLSGIINNMQQSGAERREERAEKRAATVAKTSNAADVLVKTDGQGNTDFSGLADAIGERVSAAFKNGQFTFEFANDKSGVLNFS